jgi:hypothetical protein
MAAVDTLARRHSLCYSGIMPMAVSKESTNVFRVEMRGVVRKADLDQCQERLAAEMLRVGPVRLLFVLDGFEGWDPRDNWSDLTFYVRHGDRIERMAIVGDEKWRSQSLMFAGADLRKAPVEFFASAPAATDAARAWLAGSQAP